MIGAIRAAADSVLDRLPILRGRRAREQAVLLANIIRESGLFDSEWYAEQHPQAGVDPILHYILGIVQQSAGQHPSALMEFEQAQALLEGDEDPLLPTVLVYQAMADSYIALGQADEALEQLQKEYASSRWLNDAKALQVEVRQASGQPVSPERQDDEDLKILAINTLINSDPERAVPLLEKILSSGSASPKLKLRR